MNTGAIHAGMQADQASAWGHGDAFEPMMPLAQGIKRAVNFVGGPARLLSEGDDRLRSRRTVELSAPLVQKIRHFGTAVLHGGEEVAAAASPLVRKEAARLAVDFAERALELIADPDEVAMPSVLQAPSGAIQFEWHRKGIDLEISVLPSGRIAGYVESEGHDPREVDLSAGMWEIVAELNAVLRR